MPDFSAILPSESLQFVLEGSFLIFTLVLARVSGLVMTAPIYGTQDVPVRVRALLAVALAMLIAPLHVGGFSIQINSLVAYAVLIGGELIIGLVLGMGIRILFSGIQVAGQIIGQMSGMALADVFNPGFNENVPLFSQILYFVTLAVFVLTGGHRLVMEALLDTFAAMPPGHASFSEHIVEALISTLAESFSLGVRAAAPVMTALLLATLVLGLISRTMPQLNIIAVGFGINALVTFGGLFVSLGALVWIFQEQIEPLLSLLSGALVGTPVDPGGT
ncbi:MAG: flagellar biosynthetic protein FliR [Pirellulales bacterium]